MSAKTCARCFNPTLPNEFVLNRHATDNASSWCKACMRQYNKERRRSPHGLAVSWWSSMNARCLDHDKKHKSYALIGCDFTRDGFLRWAENALATFWQQFPAGVPSLDRIDPAANYSSLNCRVLDKVIHARYGKKKDARRIRIQQDLPWIPPDLWKGISTQPIQPRRFVPPDSMFRMVGF